MPLAFTYSGDPSTSPGDEVRFLLGDTDATDPQLGDPEINYLLNQKNGNSYLAASLGAGKIASKYSRMVDRSVGDLKISYSQRQKQYASLAADLLDQALTTTGAGAPYMGGMTLTDKSFDETNTDLEQPFFTRGQMDYFQKDIGQPSDNPIPGSED